MTGLLKNGPALALIGAVLGFSPASAHEFWIEPENYAVDSGDQIRADIRIGQDFTGDAFPFIPARFRSFSQHDAQGVDPVAGNIGELPALTAMARADGLTLFTYVSSERRITFQAWEKFQEYLDYEGIKNIPERHQARGLPRDRIREVYFRCAKSLVNVGPEVSGEDRATGMPIELVAKGNPATLKPGEPIQFQLLWQGEPLADTQVALFHKPADGTEADRITTRTDGDGLVAFTLATPGAFMAAAVHMTEPEPEQDADWQSHWATLTFAVE
ncbi:DUF4198 domain-containing protein [Hoeflea sp.]|uniref:DUF4198 domain-containing protein n=1 Tax=Hoeflea sp. TaxID=1940281 RepID=UPI003BAF96D6